jgi:signal transduction histidine kinase
MTDAKSRAAAAIARASHELDRALREIDGIQTYDPTLVGHVAHALSNYLSVTSATVEMLRLNLRDYPDPDVPNWVDGIGHAADLMLHSVNRLVSHSAPRDFPLKLERVNLVLLMERACEYYRRKPGAEQVRITCTALEAVPLAWGDRVAIAVVADNLLAHALRAAQEYPGSVRVQLMAEPGHAVCSVTQPGPALTPAEQDKGLGEFGLAVAVQFVRRMDGDLWCDSEPGDDPSFAFRLPAHE